MLQTAKEREFRPKYVCFDGWYSSLANLKAVRGHGWHFLTRLKCNRQVNPDDTENVAVEDIDIPAHGREVHLKGFGMIQVFRTVASNGDAQHWATDDLKMENGERNEWVRQVFAIENYHRALKQCCGVERAQVRSAKAQKCHILLSLREGAEVPYFAVFASVRAFGSAPSPDGCERLRRQNGPHS